jgi:hypothetical protein
MIIWLTHTGGKDSTPDLAMLASDLFYGFKNKQDAKLSIWVPSKRGADLGFPNVLNFEGVDVLTDHDCPAGEGHVVNLDHMTLSSLTSSLFHSKGPTYSMDTDSWKWHAGWFGNCKYSPKHFGKLAVFAG